MAYKSSASDGLKTNTSQSALKIAFIRILVVGVFLGAWKAAGSLGFMNPVFIGSPEGTAVAFVTQLYGDANIWIDFLYTAIETGIGFGIGSVLGVLAGVILFQSPIFRKAVMPLLVAANSLPRVALAPLFILWFGLGIEGKVALIVNLIFFVMLMTTLAGFTQPNKDLDHLARTIGCTSRQQIFYFILPAAVPTLNAGLELSLTYSFLGAVAGEMVGGSHGIGVRLTAFANSFEIDQFMALLLLLVVISTAAVKLMQRFTGRLVRWHAVEQGMVG